MNRSLLLSIAERLMRCPAVPYLEQLPTDELLAICAENDLPAKSDKFGNIIVRLESGNAPPIVFAAHLDHPGFVVRSRLDDGRWCAEFLGGVGDQYFTRGVPLLVLPGRQKALLGERLSPDERLYEIRVEGAESAEFAVWDLPNFSLRGERIIGRACDDLIGCATALAALIALRKERAKVNVEAIFSRAEEVGFHGALAAAEAGSIPRNGLVISLETSRELPPVKMGAGVIIRVGDRASTFDSAATRFLAEIAEELKKENPRFQYQRALMAGGTCEATAYQERGYRCGALCVALGNYHNCAAGNRIGPEFVSASDAACMTDLLVSAARRMKTFDEIANRLRKRLDALGRDAKEKLRRGNRNG